MWSSGTSDPDGVALLLSALVDGPSIQLAMRSPALTRPQLLRLCRATAELYLGRRPQAARRGRQVEDTAQLAEGSPA